MARYSMVLAFGAVLVAANMQQAYSIKIHPDLFVFRTISTSLNQFSDNFYQKISEENPENLICSPLSASMVLSMAAFGAGGETATQMRRGLHFSPYDRQTKYGFATLITSLNRLTEVQLKVANKIFTASNLEVKPSFQNVTSSYFKSPTQSLDFGQPDAASATINSWCSAQTNGLIKEVIQPDDLASAAMVLVNAVYFKGKWMSPFMEFATRPQPFYLTETTAEYVPTMYNFARYGYGWINQLNAQFVELPYQSDRFTEGTSMFIILPNTIEGLKNVESGLQNVNFAQIRRASRETEVHVFLPKFRAESTLDLVPTLEKMGMERMFSVSANFTGITDSAPLKISKVFQKAVIEVNEQGSEAAAITAAIPVLLSAQFPPPQPVIMRIDRPFMYAIVHKGTNTVLFQGHITKPVY